MGQDVTGRGTRVPRTGQGCSASGSGSAGVLAWLLHAKGWWGVRVCRWHPPRAGGPGDALGAAAFPAIPSSRDLELPGPVPLGGGVRLLEQSLRGGWGAARFLLSSNCPPAAPNLCLLVPGTCGSLGAPCTPWLECHFQKHERGYSLQFCSAVKRKITAEDYSRG